MEETMNRRLKFDLCKIIISILVYIDDLDYEQAISDNIPLNQNPNIENELKKIYDFLRNPRSENNSVLIKVKRGNFK